jgi:hypothetical protein
MRRWAVIGTRATQHKGRRMRGSVKESSGAHNADFVRLGGKGLRAISVGVKEVTLNCDNNRDGKTIAGPVVGRHKGTALQTIRESGRESVARRGEIKLMAKGGVSRAIPKAMHGALNLKTTSWASWRRVGIRQLGDMQSSQAMTADKGRATKAVAESIRSVT